jgi:hypothetical protein
MLLVLLVMMAGCDMEPDSPAVLQTTVTSSRDTTAAAEPARRISDGKEVFREPVNDFVVLEERSDLAAIHVRSKWVHLSFDTPDRLVNVTLTDDGAQLSASVYASDCFSTVRPLQYERTEDESALYGLMVDLVASCKAQIAGADEYLELLQRAKPGFPAAMRVMKARVSQTFSGRMERCTLPDPDEELHPHHPCR